MPGFMRLIYLIGIALAVVMPIRTWVGEPIVIVSGSMEPTISVRELMILDKWTLRRRPPQKGDIVSFRSPMSKEDLVKRVIAVPGDTVELRAKVVFVNNQRQDEPFAVHSRANSILDGDDLGPLTVPANSFFVLGDNRDESNDSSVWTDSSGEHSYFLKASALQGFVRELPWL